MRAGEVDVEHRLVVVGVERHEPAGEVGLEVGLHRLLGELEITGDVARGGDAGRGDDDVQAVEALDRGPGHRVGVDPAGDVDRDERGPAAELLDLRDGLLARAVEQVGHDDRGALLGEAHRGGPSEAVPTPGDDGHLARQPPVGHVALLVCAVDQVPIARDEFGTDRRSYR